MWVSRLVALGALCAGSLIVVPGVDPLALAAMNQLSGGLLGLFNLGSPDTSFASLFAVATAPLLTVSLVLGLLASTDPGVTARRQRIGVIVYLVWCTVAAYGQALQLESMGRGFDGFAPVLVRNTGFQFRALAVLTWIAAAALLWFLAQWVTNRGAILGAALLTGALVAVHDVALLQSAWRSALAEVPMFSPILHALPWMVGLGALWAFAPKQWPVRGPGGFPLRSRLEVVLLPVAAGQLLRVSELSSVVLSLGFSIAVAIALSRDRAGRGSPLFLVLGALLPLPAIATVVLPLGQQLLERRAPGPFAGQGRFEVELACAAANAEVVSHDARILEARLKRSGVSAQVQPVGTALRLTLEQIASAQEVLAAMTPRYRLSFQLVARDESRLSPDALDWRGAGLQIASDYAGDAIVAPTAEGLTPLIANLEVPAGFEVAIECRDRSGAMGCSPRLLETGAVLGSDTIVEVNVVADSLNEPSVALVFNSEGARQLANLTSESGRQLAIVLDERVLSAPTIQGRIEGGRANITLGRSGSREKLLAEARQLANGLQSEPLGCAWETSSVNVMK